MRGLDKQRRGQLINLGSDIALVVGSMTPKIYGNGYRIVQAPGVVVLMAEMIHEARVIPLDGRAHVAELQWQARFDGQSGLREHGAAGRRAHHTHRGRRAALGSNRQRSEDLHAAVHHLDPLHVAARISGAAVRVPRGKRPTSSRARSCPPS
jgi:hypothetical protein